MIYFILFIILAGGIKTYVYTNHIKPDDVLSIRLKNYDDKK